jgi:hypothetical protein
MDDTGRTARSLDARAWIALGVAAAAGWLGLLPRALGGVDPFAALAWTVLAAAPAGFACGALGVRLLPMGLAPPAAWMLALVQADLAGGRDLGAAIAPGLLAAGLYLVGLGGGGARERDTAGALRGAGLLLAAALGLAWLGVATGVAAGADAFAAAHPSVQAVLLELSPLAPAFDAAGWDWMRASPLAYRLAGAEWVARAPWDAVLAAGGAVVVGCIAALLLPRLGGRAGAPARS